MPRAQKRPARRPRRSGRVVRANFTPQLGREICARIAAGELWTHIAGHGRMPACGTLYAWLHKRPAFAEAFAQAREIAAEGGGDLPSNLHLMEGDPMTERDVTQDARDRRQERAADGSSIHVDYGPEVVDTICERLAKGEMWIRFCTEPGMPSYGTFYRWRRERPEAAAAVAEARRIAGEARFERALEVALDTTSASAQADKLKVATLLHHAERLDPQQFGPPGRRGPEGRGGGHIQTFVIRHIERVDRPDGTSELIARDTIQEVER
jgi:hypothetical protein